MEQAGNNSNISINLLMSANQQKIYTAQSVTNTAVSASNIQIASNAIVRLAADLGGVFAILSAADFGSDIYDQSQSIREYINATAYAAKNVALSAMDSSKLIAEVSSPAIVEAAKFTNDSIASLLQIVSSDFDAINAALSVDDAALSLANSNEQIAQGKLQMINIENFATKAAHGLNNTENNLGLAVQDICIDSFNVIFNPISNPFDDENIIVGSYKIIIVKDTAKSIFSIINAENLLLSNDPTSQSPPQFQQVQALNKKMHQYFKIDTVNDSDNEPVTLGKKYVAFVYASLLEQYKKSINNFDDYLSASSAPFELKKVLKSPDHTTITVTPIVLTSSENVQHLNFEIPTDNPSNVEYRCMFLPHSSDLTKGLLTENMLRTQLKEIKKLEQIADEYEPLISDLQAQLNNLTADLSQSAKNNNEIIKIKQDLKLLKTKEQKKIQSLLAPQNPSPGFFFNLKLAEQVSAANYDIVHNDSIAIAADTTDNFGNMLIEAKSYVPVILTVSTVSEENLNQFTNTLTDFTKTKPFVYTAQHKI